MRPDAQIVRVFHLSVIEVEQVRERPHLGGLPGDPPRLSRPAALDVQLELGLRLLGLLQAAHEVPDQHLIAGTKHQVAHPAPV